LIIDFPELSESFLKINIFDIFVAPQTALFQKRVTFAEVFENQQN